MRAFNKWMRELETLLYLLRGCLAVHSRVPLPLPQTDLVLSNVNLSPMRAYPLYVQPPDVLHDEFLVHAFQDSLDTDQRLPEVVVHDDEHQVVVGEGGQLDE